MAVTNNGRVWQLTAAGDELSADVMVGHRINKIHVTQPSGTGGAFTLRAGGSAGIIIVDAVSVLNDTVSIQYPTPQDLSSLYVSVLPASATVVVFLVPK